MQEHSQVRRGNSPAFRSPAGAAKVTNLEQALAGRHTSTDFQPSERWGTTRFDEALVGGVLGATIGIPMGILLLRGAVNGQGCSPDRDHDPGRSDRTIECGLARIGAGAFGVLSIGGASTFGAIRRANLKSNISVWFPSAFSSALLGGSAYLLSEPLGTTTTERTLIGIGVAIPFAALGAAGGAILGRDDSEPRRAKGAVTGRKGNWRLKVPDVRIQWIQHPGERRVGVQVTLLSVEL